jgi:hypothetical protein
MPNNRASHIARQHFFSKQVYMDVWKDSMAGENEKAVLEILEERKKTNVRLTDTIYEK